VSIDGHIYRITDPKGFFLPILDGQGPPREGYKPWCGVEVLSWAVDTLLPIPLPGGMAVSRADGSFSIAQQPPNPGLGDPSDARLGLTAFDTAFPYRPLYRSGLDMTLSEGQSAELNIYLFPDMLSPTQGASAGDVSEAVDGAGLPGDTTITASPSALAFSGSSLGAHVKFGISLIPDTSFELDRYLDLRLDSWDISVGWPADWCTNAEDILIDIHKGLYNAGSSMNDAVLAKMESVFKEEELPSLALAKKFFGSEVSVTFMDVGYPTPHSWSVSSTEDKTIVVTADPCIGYPRHLTSEPSKRPPLKLSRVSKPLRPILI
jgi:hypothetical protein